MSRLRARIRELGGAAATHELHRIGASRERLRLAIREREIRRIRQGWHIDPDTPAPVADAFRVGGRATCATAAAFAGLWLPAPPDRVHVAVAPNACRLRDPDDYRRRLAGTDAVVHWTDDGVGPSRLVVPLPRALIELAGCEGAEAAFVAAECAVARRLMRLDEWRRACRGADAATTLALSGVTGASGGFTEALFLFRSRHLPVRIRRQVQIGPDRVDFVLGDRLVIEVDGREFHERERDYERDARLGARGYRVLRFAYRQVMFDWPAVEAAILSAIARGDDH